MDIGLVHWVACPLMPHLLLLVAMPDHEGMARRVDLGGWFAWSITYHCPNWAQYRVSLSIKASTVPISHTATNLLVYFHKNGVCRYISEPSVVCVLVACFCC